MPSSEPAKSTVPAATKAGGTAPRATPTSPVKKRARSTNMSSTRSTTRVPITLAGGTRSAPRKPKARTKSPARSGTVLFTAMLARKGRKQFASGSAGSSTRSIHHQRTMRTV
jgi:hypothetical protein